MEESEVRTVTLPVGVDGVAATVTLAPSLQFLRAALIAPEEPIIVLPEPSAEKSTPSIIELDITLVVPAKSVVGSVAPAMALEVLIHKNFPDCNLTLSPVCPNCNVVFSNTISCPADTVPPPKTIDAVVAVVPAFIKAQDLNLWDDAALGAILIPAFTAPDPAEKDSPCQKQ